MKKKSKNLVEWNLIVGDYDVAEWFIQLAKLDNIDSEIVRARRDNIYQYQVASKVNISIDTVKDRTSKLIKKYIEIQAHYPEILPPLKRSYYIENAMISIIPIRNKKVYSVYFFNEIFDTFEDIRVETIKRIEKEYNIELKEIGDYKTLIHGVYTHYDF